MVRLRVTPQSLVMISNSDLIQRLYNEIVVDIPENISPENFSEVNMLLGKLPNDYAYVVSLVGYSRNFTRQLKRQGEKEAYEDMIDKSKALDDIASSIKLKYQAVSRMISLYEVQLDYSDMHQFRNGGQSSDKN